MRGRDHGWFAGFAGPDGSDMAPIAARAAAFYLTASAAVRSIRRLRCESGWRTGAERVPVHALRCLSSAGAAIG